MNGEIRSNPPESGVKVDMSITATIKDLLDEIDRLKKENSDYKDRICDLEVNVARAENLIDTLSIALRQWADAHKTIEGLKP